MLIHRETIDDTIGGLLGGYLVSSGMVKDPILALALAGCASMHASEPAKPAPAARKAPAKATAKKPAAKRKPAARKTAARKPAARKTTARKPAARKTTARKWHMVVNHSVP